MHTAAVHAARLSSRRPLRRLAATAVLAAGPLASAAAQTPIPASAPDTVSLATALRSAYERSPVIQKARENVRFYEGALREARGVYSPVLRLSPSVEQREGVISAGVASNENERRTGLDEVTKAFHQIRLSLKDEIDNGLTDVPPCPIGFSSALIISPGGLPECQPSGGDPTDPAAIFGSIGLFTPPTLGLSALAQFQDQIAQLLALNVQDFSENLRQQGLERVQQNYQLASELDVKYGIYRARLGGMPLYEIQRTAALDFGVAKARRSGGDIQLQLRLQGSDDNFRDRPLDPLFGGPGVQTAFRSSAALVFDQPLLRGRGAASANAGERAAVQNLAAAQERYAHAVSEQARDVARRYFDLVAARSTLTLIDDSVQTQKRLLDGIRALKKAGDVSRADVTRSTARLSDVEAQAASARANLVAAQAALAQVVGWSAPPTLSTVAEETFAPPPTDLDLAPLTRGAVAARHDLRAAESSREAARILREAAHVDSRPRLDLTVRVGLAADYYSPYFRVLKDEFSLTHTAGAPVTPDPLAPIDTFDSRSPVNFYNPAGIVRSLSNTLEPNFAVQLTFELPFGNHRRLGRLAQAEASLKRADIVSTDLARVIEHNVNEQAAALLKARAALEQQQIAASQQEATWKAAQERRVAGDMTLIDALTTEQDFTSARLDLVQAQRDFATTLVDLRFEAGRLVPFKNGAPSDADLSGLIVAR